MKQIIFFDGVCNLCNQFIDFVIRNDQKGVYFFAPLQGESAKQKLSASDLAVDSVILLKADGQVLRRSAAVFEILNSLGWPFKVLLPLKILPSFIKDRGYDWVAANRYKVFGKKKTCRIPTAEEKARFLP